MGETEEGVVTVEAEVAVLLGTVVMKSIHVVAVVLVEVVVVVVVMVEEMMTEISVPSMIGAGGREAAVLDVEGNEAEALEEGGIGVLSGKVVLKEGLRLSNGIGKGNRQNLVFRTMRITLTMTAMALTRMISIMSLSNISSMIDTMISPSDLSGLAVIVCGALCAGPDVSVVKALLKSPRASYRRKLLKNILSRFLF